MGRPSAAGQAMVVEGEDEMGQSDIASKGDRVKLLFIGLSVLIALSCILLASCTVRPEAETEASLAPTETEPETPQPTATSTVAPPPTAATPSVITLTIWTTPFFAPGETGAGAKVLTEELADFSAAYPDYRLDWVVKPATGPGGLMEFILAAQDVAPAALPDMVVVDTRDLGDLVRQGLLQPIDGLIPESVRGDLFPFARNMSVVDNVWYGLPVSVDIEHLIYNSAEVEAPPLTWADVLSDSISYGFLAGGTERNANDAFLIQYLALGGRLKDDSGKPVLDPEPLTAVLAFYLNGWQAGLFPDAILNSDQMEDVLSSYADDRVAIANVTSDMYLANRDKLRNTSFATIPTWNGSVATLGHGRAIALIAPDPSRQAAAQAFMGWVLEPERNARWTEAAGHLPPLVSAISRWDTEDSYVTFVRWQLASAFSVPSTPEYDPVYAAIQNAVHEVLAGNASPERAAEAATASVINEE